MLSRFAKLRQTLALFHITRRSIYHFFSGEMLYHAASLSFYTIFALVPILLIFITIIANLPSFESYYTDIKAYLFASMMPSKSEALISYMDSILDNGFKMGLIGIFYVILTSLLFFNNYEYIVSKIFLKPKKKFFTALSTYWTLITFTPLALSIVLYLSSSATSMMNDFFLWLHLSPKVLLSLFITWVMFYIMMKVSINFAMNNRAVVRSSFLTAVVWYIAQKLFISYIFANKTYESLYGSFSSLLFFFLWIYISWIIYLYGLKATSYIERFYGYRERQKQERMKSRPKKYRGSRQKDIKQDTPPADDYLQSIETEA